MSTREYLSKQEQMFGYRAKDRLPEGHICFLIHEVVDELELGPAARGSNILGAPCYDPRMMVKVLLYAYCTGISLSRKIEKKLHEDIAFRVLLANRCYGKRQRGDELPCYLGFPENRLKKIIEAKEALEAGPK